MSPRDLLRFLEANGIRVYSRGSNLGIDAPAGFLTPELKDAIASCKQAILEQLRGDGHLPLDLERIQSGPYAGFLQQVGMPQSDPLRAKEALEEAAEWRKKRAQWLREVLGLDGEGDV